MIEKERERESYENEITKVGIDKLDIDRSVFDDVSSFVIHGHFFEVLECKKKEKRKRGKTPKSNRSRRAIVRVLLVKKYSRRPARMICASC